MVRENPLSCWRARSTTVERGFNTVRRAEDEVTAVSVYSDRIVLGIERCRRHIGNMARMGRQCEGATLVLQRLERRLLESRQVPGQCDRHSTQRHLPLSDRKVACR
jgi:hypothetical protein